MTFPLILMKTSHSRLTSFWSPCFKSIWCHKSYNNLLIIKPKSKVSFWSLKQSAGLKKNKKISPYNHTDNTTRKMRWDSQGPLKIVCCTPKEYLGRTRSIAGCILECFGITPSPTAANGKYIKNHIGNSRSRSTSFTWD